MCLKTQVGVSFKFMKLIPTYRPPPPAGIFKLLISFLVVNPLFQQNLRQTSKMENDKVRAVLGEGGSGACSCVRVPVSFFNRASEKRAPRSVLASPMVRAADCTKHRRVTGGYGPPNGPTGHVWSTPVGRSHLDLPKATQLEQESRPVSLPSPGFQRDTRQGGQDPLPVWLTRQPHPRFQELDSSLPACSRRKGGFIQVPCSLLVSPDLLPPG